MNLRASSRACGGEALFVVTLMLGDSEKRPALLAVPAEIQRSLAVDLLELMIEVADVLKAGFEGNLDDPKLSGEQQIAGCIQPQLIDISGRRLVQILPECPVHMAGASSGQLVQSRETLVQILLQLDFGDGVLQPQGKFRLPGGLR